jgi:hypothetical protein
MCGGADRWQRSALFTVYLVLTALAVEPEIQEGRAAW